MMPEGILSLLFTITNSYHRTIQLVDFFIIHRESGDNSTIGHPYMNESQCAISMHYLAIMILSQSGLSQLKAAKNIA